MNSLAKNKYRSWINKTIGIDLLSWYYDGTDLFLGVNADFR